MSHLSHLSHMPGVSHDDTSPLSLAQLESLILHRNQLVEQAHKMHKGQRGAINHKQDSQIEYHRHLKDEIQEIEERIQRAQRQLAAANGGNDSSYTQPREGYTSSGSAEGYSQLSDVSQADKRRKRTVWYPIVSFMHRMRYIILIFWLLISGLNIWWGPQLLQRTVESFGAPQDSPGAQANAAFTRAFPTMDQESSIIIYVKAKHQMSLAPDNASLAWQAVLALSNAVNRTVTEGRPFPSSPSSLTPDELSVFRNFDSLSQACQPSITSPQCVMSRSSFLSGDTSATILNISINAQYTSKPAFSFNNGFADILNNEVCVTNTTLPIPSPHACPCCYLDAEIVSVPSFIDDIVASSEADLGMMDSICLPIAMLILAATVRSLRLMIIPLACILCAVLTAFSLVTTLTLFVNIASFAPSLMTSILIAMGVDYALFILTRYREELEGRYQRAISLGQVLKLQDGAYPVPSVVLNLANVDTSIAVITAVMQSSGHTILTSGFTLMLCFLSLLMFRVEILTCCGLSSACAIAAPLLTNLTLLPALFLTFPSFFSRCVDPWQISLCACCSFGSQERFPGFFIGRYREKPALLLTSVDDREIGESVNGPHPSLTSKEEKSHWKDEGEGDDGTSIDVLDSSDPSEIALTSTYWYRFAAAMNWPWNLIVFLIIVGACVPLFMHSIGWQRTDSFVIALPDGSDAKSALEHLSSDFGAASLFPYRLLFSTNTTAASCNSPHALSWWNVQTNTRAMLIKNLTDVSQSSFKGVADLPKAVVQACMTDPVKVPAESQFICATARRFIRSDCSAAWSVFTPNLDPLGVDGSPFLRKLRGLLKDSATTNDVLVTVSGIGSDSWDSVDIVYDQFGLLLCATAGVVATILGFAFWSVLIPVRAVVVITVTLGIVYGLAAIVYEPLYWFPPATTAVILVGLSLDYECFLLGRIGDYYYVGGYSARESLLRGYARTGWVITIAGLIMTVAFGGLMLSSLPLLRLLGFYLCIGVLVDTFILRAIICPATLSLLGEANWWPGSWLDATRREKRRKREVVEEETERRASTGSY